jgi:hypothetical protein
MQCALLELQQCANTHTHTHLPPLTPCAHPASVGNAASPPGFTRSKSSAGTTPLPPLACVEAADGPGAGARVW